MTKDTEEFSQFTESVACRVYTLPRAEKSSDPKGWIRGNAKIGVVLEITTSFLQGKNGLEIRFESVNKGNSHSSVRISHGLNKLVTNLNNNEQETSEMQFEDYALKTNVLAFASRSKDKAKPQRHFLPAHQQKLYPLGKELGLILSQKLIRQSLTQCQNNGVVFFVMVIYLEKKMERLDSAD